MYKEKNFERHIFRYAVIDLGVMLTLDNADA